jgi:hypothetical protein
MQQAPITLSSPFYHTVMCDPWPIWRYPASLGQVNLDPAYSYDYVVQEQFLVELSTWEEHLEDSIVWYEEQVAEHGLEETLSAFVLRSNTALTSNRVRRFEALEERRPKKLRLIDGGFTQAFITYAFALQNHIKLQDRYYSAEVCTTSFYTCSL